MPSKKKPKDEIIPSGRGLGGKFTKGNLIGADTRIKKHPNANITKCELQVALAKALSTEQIQALIVYAYNLCFDEDLTHKERLDYMGLVFDRTVGRPKIAYDIKQETSTTNASLSFDLGKLSNDELKSYLALQNKIAPDALTVPVVEVLEVKPLIHDATN